MKIGWKTKKLGEICELISRGISPKYTEKQGILVLNQRCVRDHFVNFEFARFHDVSVKSVSKERIIRKGDVLVNSTGTGTLGRVAQVKKTEHATVDSHVTIIRPQKGIFFEDFFGYSMISIEKLIALAGEGCGGQTELSRSKLKDFEISFPDSLEEQKRVSAILDKAFATLDKAKANTEKNLQNVKELFESYLQGVFQIEKWETKGIGEVCEEIFAGGDAPKNAFSLEPTSKYQIPIFANAVKGKGLYGYTDFARVSKPCVTIAARGSGTGHTELREGPFLPIVRLIVCLPDSNYITPEFLKYTIDNLVIERSGSAIPQLTVPMIKEYEIPIPSLQEQNQIINRAEIIKSQKVQLEKIYAKRIERYNDLKRSILQKAFSGGLV